MTEASGKPVHIVDVHKFRKNDRWYGYKFTIVKKSLLPEKVTIQHLQVYGMTALEAEARVHESLRYHYGTLGYSINVVP